MDIEFKCNKCGQHVVIEEAGAGLTVPCPKCGQSLAVPKPPSATATKKCPFCAEEIRSDAVKCKHCGEFLDGSRPPQTTPAAPKASGKTSDKIVAGVMLLIFVAVVAGAVILILDNRGILNISQIVRTVASDPTEQLKGIVEGYQKHWSSISKISDFSYDVRKTDSLVSPYLGTLHFREDRGTASEQEYEVVFVYQDKKWVVKQMRSRYATGSDRSWEKVEKLRVQWWNEAIERYYQGE